MVSEIPFFHPLVLTDYLACKCIFPKCISLAGIPFLLGFLLLRVSVLDILTIIGITMKVNLMSSTNTAQWRNI